MIGNLGSEINTIDLFEIDSHYETDYNRKEATLAWTEQISYQKLK